MPVWGRESLLTTSARPISCLALPTIRRNKMTGPEMPERIWPSSLYHQKGRHDYVRFVIPMRSRPIPAPTKNTGSPNWEAWTPVELRACSPIHQHPPNQTGCAKARLCEKHHPSVPKVLGKTFGNFLFKKIAPQHVQAGRRSNFLAPFQQVIDKLPLQIIAVTAAKLDTAA